MTGDERPTESAGLIATMSAWRIDRRRFLQVAGATGMAALAGCVGARPSAAPLQLGPRVNGAAASAGTAPPVLSSVSDLARSLEYDLLKIFRFVSDEVRYEPYAGVLRGSRGTLWGRAGNSADQAMLLAGLLDASLVPYRFVTGALDDAGVQALAGAAVADATAAADEARSVLLGHGGTAAATAPASPGPDAQAFLARSRDAGSALASSASAQIQAGISTITTALAGSGISLPAPVPELPDLERTAHVWVQYGSGPQWIDLDPTRPGAAVGETMATAGAPLSALPDEQRHSLIFHVIAESVSAGKLVQQVVLEHTEFADALVGVPVTFINAKPDGLKGLGFSIGGALAGTTQYLPALAVGASSFVGGTALTFGGQGGVGGAFGQPGTNEGETTAEWLELQILSPGAPPAISRRQIFDRVGASARASGTFDPATLSPVQLVDLDAETKGEFPPCRTVHSFAVVGGSVSGDYFSQDFARNDAFANAAVVGHLYHYIRDALNAQLSFPAGTRPFCDAPNVTSYSVVPLATVSGSLNLSVAVDIWRRSFGTQALQGATATTPAAVLAGVVSEVAERVTFGEGLPPDPSRPAATPLSVGRIFEEAAKQGIAVQAMRGSGLPAGTPYPPDTAARMAEALSAGNVVIAPAQLVAIDGNPRLGWWLVDPTTGRTADELDDGRGPEAAEYSIPLTTEGKVVGFFERMAMCASTYAIAASIFLGEGSVETSGDLSTVLSIAAGIASQMSNLANVPGC